MEGITYDPATNSLLWVDIVLAEVHRVSLADESKIEESHEVVTFSAPGESIGALFLTKEPNVVLVCAKNGVARADFSTKSVEYVFKYPQSEHKARILRSNDGILDPWGNIWIGLMNDFPVIKTQGKVNPDGVLYKIDAGDWSVKKMVEGALIPNGLAFSQDGKKFYWTDSLTFTVWQFDYDGSELSNRAPLVNMKEFYPEENSPEPDGLCMTKDGVIYDAVFGTSTVAKYTLSKELLAKYRFPASRITCTVIGGRNDDELFITTAHADHTDLDAPIDALDKSGDLGGFLYRVKLDEKANSQPKTVWAGGL